MWPRYTQPMAFRGRREAISAPRIGTGMLTAMSNPVSRLHVPTPWGSRTRERSMRNRIRATTSSAIDRIPTDHATHLAVYRFTAPPPNCAPIGPRSEGLHVSAQDAGKVPGQSYPTGQHSALALTSNRAFQFDLRLAFVKVVLGE